MLPYNTLIIFISLFLFPILGFLLKYWIKIKIFRNFFKNNPKYRTYLNNFFISISTITFSSLLTGISTTSIEVDISFLSITFLTFCIYTYFFNYLRKYTLIVFINKLIIYLSFCLSTVGFIFLIYFYSLIIPDSEVHFGDKYICKTYHIFNGIAGEPVKLEISKKLNYLCFLETKVMDKQHITGNFSFKMDHNIVYYYSPKKNRVIRVMEKDSSTLSNYKTHIFDLIKIKTEKY